jgi:membrane fusion protein (multidrug efflux system)
MKLKYLFTALALTGMMACGSNADDKAMELELLKKQQAELTQKIKSLEDELRTSGELPPVGKQVVVNELTAGAFQTFVEVQGRVDARESVEVSAENMGIVKKILVREGDQVKEGAVLAELDNAMIRQSMEEVKTQLDFARQLFEKQESLWQQKIGTEVQYLQAKNQKESLEKRLATLQSQLETTRVKSPVSGTVDELNIKLGQAVSPGFPLFRVVNFDKMRVVAELAEAYIAKIRPGDAVELYFKDYGRNESSKVAHVAKTINQINRTFRVEASLNTKGAIYNPNMIVVMRIKDYQVDSALTVPVNLIQRSETGSYVMVAEQEQGQWMARKRYITTGKSYASQSEVADGLKAGDRLITVGYNDLNDGQQIRF